MIRPRRENGIPQRSLHCNLAAGIAQLPINSHSIWMPIQCAFFGGNLETGRGF
jgi:hypothetical protein